MDLEVPSPVIATSLFSLHKRSPRQLKGHLVIRPGLAKFPLRGYRFTKVTCHFCPLILWGRSPVRTRPRARADSQQPINSVARGDAWGTTRALTPKSILTEGQHGSEVMDKLVHEAEHCFLSDMEEAV